VCQQILVKLANIKLHENPFDSSGIVRSICEYWDKQVGMAKLTGASSVTLNHECAKHEQVIWRKKLFKKERYMTDPQA
jgi:hypothetical protein